jgi:hypothetical protein
MKNASDPCVLGGRESLDHETHATGPEPVPVELPEVQHPKARRAGRRGFLDREGVLGLAAFLIFVVGNGLNFVALGLIQVLRDSPPGPVSPRARPGLRNAARGPRS